MKLSFSEYSKRVASVNPNIKIIGNYISTKEPIEVECKVCGHRWFPNSRHISRHSSPCEVCERARLLSDLKEKVKLSNPNIEILGTYIDAHTPILCKCKQCGNSWPPSPNSLSNGKGCPVCSIKIRSQKRALDNETFIKRVLKNNPELEILDQYKNNNRDRVRVKCTKCGHIWKALPSTLMYDKATCEKCFNFLNKTTESFIEEMQKINPNIEIIGEYNNTETPIACRCKLCGNEWTPTPTNLLKGKGCKECSNSGSSFIEQFILLYFRELYGLKAVKSRNKTAIGKELDIYLPDFNFAIEPGAWDLHKNKLSTDVEKILMCQHAGIELITVFYICPFKVADVLSQLNKYGDIGNARVMVYEENLAYENNREKLLALAKTLNTWIKNNKQDHLSDETITRIRTRAYIQSRRKTTDTFKNQLSEINPSIEVCSQYLASNRPITVKCKKCGYIWNPIASRLLLGSGCPKCSNRKTHDEYLEILKQTNSTFEPLEPYKGAQVKIMFQCKKCGDKKPLTPDYAKRAKCRKCKELQNQQAQKT